MKGHNDEDILVEDDGYHLIEFFFLFVRHYLRWLSGFCYTLQKENVLREEH